MKHRKRIEILIAAVLLFGPVGWAPPTTERSVGSAHPTNTDVYQKSPQKISDADANRVLVLVGGKPITEGDLHFLMISRSVPKKLRQAVRKQFLEQLIDRRLMQAFLADRKAKPDKILLEEQITRFHQLLRRNGKDPEKTLAKIGFTPKVLRNELALPLAWKTQVNRMVTPKRLRDYFQQHRQEFDGTQVRASQILLKVANPSDSKQLQAAQDRLQTVRRKISSGEISFSDAAAKNSQAPSRKTGGDVGFFRYRGKMPEVITKVAFSLKKGELSKPFVTPFGVHLLKVTDRKPGNLSLEDARRDVLKQLSGELWDETIQQQRSRVKIEWKIELK
jgi:peptidyl-prolyl cis-trans isomerase C